MLFASFLDVMFTTLFQRQVYNVDTMSDLVFVIGRFTTSATSVPAWRM